MQVLTLPDGARSVTVLPAGGGSPVLLDAQTITSGTGIVDSVQGGDGIVVDSSDPANPVVNSIFQLYQVPVPAGDLQVVVGVPVTCRAGQTVYFLASASAVPTDGHQFAALSLACVLHGTSTTFASITWDAIDDTTGGAGTQAGGIGVLQGNTGVISGGSFTLDFVFVDIDGNGIRLNAGGAITILIL